MTTSHESSKPSQEKFERERKRTLSITVGVSALLATGLIVNSCEADKAAMSPEPTSTTVAIEQEALDLVDQDPESLNPDNIDHITIPEGGSINGAVSAAAKEYADEHDWDGKQRNRNQGAINVASDKLQGEVNSAIPAGADITVYADPEGIYVPIEVDVSPNQ